MYRVRKNWNEPKTQLGAYNILDYAIECCNKAGSEYFVFDGVLQYVKEKIGSMPYEGRAYQVVDSGNGIVAH